MNLRVRPIDAMGDLFDSLLEGSLESLDAGVDAVDSALGSVAASIDRRWTGACSPEAATAGEEKAGEEKPGAAVEDRSRPVVTLSECEVARSASGLTG